MVLVVSYMLVFFHRMAPAAMASELTVAFNTTGVALGSLAATYFYVYTVMQIPAGVLADTLGPRASVTLGALVSGAGSILFGVAQTFGFAILGRFLVGLGVSVVFVGLMRSNAVWFSDRHYGRIAGLTVLLGNLGAISAAAPLAWVLGYLTWRQVFVSIGLLSAVMAQITWSLVRNRPEAFGLPSVRELDGLPSHAAHARHWRHELLDVLRNRDIWPGFWVLFGITGNLLSFAGLWGVPLLQDVFALDKTAASLYTTASLLAFAVGCLLMGWLSDHLGLRKPVLVATCILSSIAWFLLAAMPWGTGWSGFTLYGLLGLTAGGFVVAFAAAKEVCRPASAGMGVAVVNTGLFLGAAIVQTVFGGMLDLTWDGVLTNGLRQYAMSDYRNGLWLSFGFAVLALVAATRIRETHCRNITLAE